MSRTVRRAVGMLAALAVTGGIVALSRAPYATGDRGARLRLSWSGRPERIERCRELTDAELAERPAHMRQRLECEGRPARYLVRVAVDRAVRSLDTVTGGGLRGDRAIHMLREYRLESGTRAIAVTVTRLDPVEEPDDEPEVGSGADRPHDDDSRSPAAPPDRGYREREERRRQRQEALPPLLELDTTVSLEAGRVLLVTYDPAARRLAALTGAGR